MYSQRFVHPCRKDWCSCACFRERYGSNLGQVIVLDRGFSLLSSVFWVPLRGKYRDCLRQVPSRPFPAHESYCHSTLHGLNYWHCLQVFYTNHPVLQHVLWGDHAIHPHGTTHVFVTLYAVVYPCVRQASNKGLWNGLWEAVKCTLVQALRLCTGRTAHRGSRGIALLLHDDGTRRGWGISITPRPLFTPGKDPVPIVQEAGWAPGPVWTGAENLDPTGIRSPDSPARSQSLYRLHYAAYCGRH